MVNEKALMNLVSTVASTTNFTSNSLLSSIKIPIATNDEDVKKIIAEYNLQNPDEAINFFVEMCFEQVETINSSINELKELDLLNSISQMKSAHQSLKFGFDNPDSKNEELNVARRKLMDTAELLKGKVKWYISKIREIDNLPRRKFFMRASQNLKSANTNVFCARQALDALVVTINLQIMISREINVNIDAIIEEFYNFVNEELLKNDTIVLMAAYDEKKQDEFWPKLRERIEDMKKLPEMMKNAYLDDEQDEDIEIDFE